MNFKKYYLVTVIAFVAGVAMGCEYHHGQTIPYEAPQPEEVAAIDPVDVTPSGEASPVGDIKALQDRLKTLEDQLGEAVDALARKDVSTPESTESEETPPASEGFAEVPEEEIVSEEGEETEDAEDAGTFPLVRYVQKPVAVGPTAQTPPTLLWVNTYLNQPAILAKFSKEIDVAAAVQAKSIEIVDKSAPSLIPHLVPGGILIGLGSLDIAEGEKVVLRIWGADVSESRAVRDLQGNLMATTETYFF